MSLDQGGPWEPEREPPREDDGPRRLRRRGLRTGAAALVLSVGSVVGGSPPWEGFLLAAGGLAYGGATINLAAELEADAALAEAVRAGLNTEERWHWEGHFDEDPVVARAARGAARAVHRPADTPILAALLRVATRELEIHGRAALQPRGRLRALGDANEVDHLFPNSMNEYDIGAIRTMVKGAARFGLRRTYQQEVLEGNPSLFRRDH